MGVVLCGSRQLWRRVTTEMILEEVPTQNID